ncbi:MAG: ABC transporter permease, partial [Bacillota bacterium]
MWTVIVQIFPYAIAFTIPLLITALGGLFSERSGVVNIGLEGLMVIGFFASALVISKLELALPDIAIGLGLLAAFIAGALFSLLHAFACISLNANQVISGTAINMIAGALTVFLARNMTGSGNILIIHGLVRSNV